MLFMKVCGPMLWAGASFWRRIITREQRCICCTGKEGEGETSGKPAVHLNWRQKLRDKYLDERQSLHAAGCRAKPTQGISG